MIKCGLFSTACETDLNAQVSVNPLTYPKLNVRLMGNVMQMSIKHLLGNSVIHQPDTFIL